MCVCVCQILFVDAKKTFTLLIVNHFHRLKIITEKPSGAVAGWQERDGGPIKYDNHLPVDTLISRYAAISVFS